MCKDKEGNILGDEGMVMERWIQYFKELLNRSCFNIEDGNNIEFDGPENDIPKPTRSMVYEIIKRLKMNRAPGIDGITNELLKYGGRILSNRIYNLILMTRNKEVLPTEWQNAIICPIYKKSDKLQSKNYRGILLLNVTCKVYTSVIAKYYTQKKF